MSATGKVRVVDKVLSQKEKEEYCLLSSITLLDSSVEGPYLEYKDPEELLTTAEYVKLLEVSTIGELKSLLRHKDFASNYTEDDWTSLYEEVEYFGIIAIEEEMERMVSNYGY